MPQKMTKKELNAILVAERRKSRIKHQNSAFMNRTRGIYSGQSNRYAKSLNVTKVALPYSLDALRKLCQRALLIPCCYCGENLTVKTMCPDHRQAIARGGSWKLSNLAIVHQKCNWRKGMLNEAEFRYLVKFVRKYLAPEAAKDFWGRLATGGKWNR